MANDTSRLPGVWGIDKETSAIPVMPGQRLVAIVAPFLNGAVDRPFLASADNYKELVGGYNSKLSKPDYGYLCLEETLKKAPSVLVCRVADRDKLEKGIFQNEMMTIRTKFGTEVYNGLEVSVAQGGFSDEIVLTIGNESYNLSVDPKSDRYVANLGNFSTIYECVAFNPEGNISGGTEPEPEPGELIKFDKEVYALAIFKNPGDWRLSEDKFVMIKDFIPWKEANEILDKEQSGRAVAKDNVVRKILIELRKRNGADFVDEELANPILSMNEKRQLVLTYAKEEPVVFDISEEDVGGSIKFTTATLNGKLNVYPIHVGEEPVWKQKQAYIDNILSWKNPFKISSDKLSMTRDEDWIVITNKDGSMFEENDIFRVFMSKNADGELQVAFGNETPVVAEISELDIGKHIKVETSTVVFSIYVTLEKEPEEVPEVWEEKELYVNAIINLVSPFLLSDDKLLITKATDRIVLRRLDGSPFGTGDNRLVVVSKNDAGDLTIKFSDEEPVVIPLARDMVNKVVTAYSDTMRYDVYETLEPEPVPEPSAREQEFVDALTSLDGKWFITEDNKTIFRNKTLYVSKTNGTDMSVTQGQFVRVTAHPEGGLNLAYNDSQPTRIRITDDDIKYGSIEAKVYNETYLYKIILSLPIPKDLPEVDPNEEQNLEEGRELIPFSESQYQRQLLEELKEDNWLQDDADVNCIRTDNGIIKVALLSGLYLAPEDGALVKVQLNLEGKLEASFNDDKPVLVHIDSENVGRHFQVDGETCRFIFYVTPIYLPQWTVSFYDGEEVMETMKVNQNSNWEIPTIEKTGYNLEGYYTDPELKNKIEGGIPVLSDVKVYTKWTVKSFSVTVFDGESAVEQKTMSFGEKFTPQNHDKPGFELVGYFYDNLFKTKVEAFPITIDRNINLYIKYRQNAFNVTIKDEKDSEVRVDNVNEKENYTPIDPTKVGYTIAGYWDNKEFSGTKITFPIKVTADRTIYVKYEPVNVTVEFNSNNGSAVENQTVKFGAKVKEPQAPTKIGYVFEGWYKEAGLTNKWNFDTDVISSESKLVLYAKWSDDMVTVKFESNGGKPIPSNQTVRFGSKLTVPESMTKLGYTFDGWYKESQFTNKVELTSYTVDVKSSMTLYAKWVAKDVKVTFNANGGSPVPAVQTVKFGAKVASPAACTKTGYTLEGWYKEEGFTNKVDFNTYTVDAEAVTLYAKWVAKDVVVTFNANSGVPAPENQTVKFGAKVSQPAEMTREGFRFDGWYKEEGFTNKVDFSKYTVDKEAVTLYAKWIEQVTITFDSKGGSKVNPITLDKGGVATKPQPDPTLAGHRFGGWYKETGLSTPVVWTEPVNANVVYYAKFEQAVMGTPTISPASVATGGVATITIPFTVATPVKEKLVVTPDSSSSAGAVAVSGTNLTVPITAGGSAGSSVIKCKYDQQAEKQVSLTITGAAARSKK